MAKHGKPIDGFHAGGEVTGVVHGTNRLDGNSISETITFGRSVYPSTLSLTIQ